MTVFPVLSHLGMDHVSPPGAAALPVQPEGAGIRYSGCWDEAATGAPLPLTIPSGPLSSATGATQACWFAIWQPLLHRHHKRYYRFDKTIPSCSPPLSSGWRLTSPCFTVCLGHVDVALSPEHMSRPPPEAPLCTPPCAPPVTSPSPEPGSPGWDPDVVCIQPSRTTTPPESLEHPPLERRNVWACKLTA